jgi:8-oxo-dGTP pyrophosphatase MutT (NUDIX family)
MPDRRGTSDPDRFVIPASSFPQGFEAELESRAASPVPARSAATIVVVKDAEGGPEVLLVQRHRRSGFAAGAWVFPGGVVDEADRDPRLIARTRGPTARQWAERMRIEEPAEAIAHVVAAIREAWEETGLLFAGAEPGMERDLPGEAQRAALLGGTMRFAELVDGSGLHLRADELVYCAHWITPEPEPRRYDTRFFLAPAHAALGGRDEASAVRFQPSELIEARWMDAAAALRGFASGELRMLPPTVHTLRRLEPFAHVSEMRRVFAAAEIPTVLPRMERSPDGLAIHLEPGESGR